MSIVRFVDPKETEARAVATDYINDRPTVLTLTLLARKQAIMLISNDAIP